MSGLVAAEAAKSVVLAGKSPIFRSHTSNDWRFGAVRPKAMPIHPIRRSTVAAPL
jgi:hypothetical protein